MNNLKNYVKAEVARAFARPGFTIVFFLLLAYIVLLTLRGVNSEDGINAVQYLDSIINNIHLVFLVYGIMIFTVTLYREFQTKTMQAAIGRGLSRKGVVAGRMLSIFWLTAIMAISITVILILVVIFRTDIHFVPANFRDLGATLVMELINTPGMIYVAMVLVYLMQGSGIAALLYLLMITGLLGKGISKLSFLPGVSVADGLYFVTMVKGFGSKLLMGIWDWPRFLGCLATIFLCFLLSYIFFRKRELEF
ncbi:MAG: hypothetical protein K6E33_08655 [Lachnospiraceae bacterium]|nr:hypothetical protein [Lachnospiraceae bacterium]